MDRDNDHQVIQAATRWLEEGAGVILVTVVRTWGSAPRRPGALMAIHPDGSFVGSVSGGCIEDELVQRVLRGEFEHKLPQLLEYGVSKEATRQVGLPCGGKLEVVVEYLDSVFPMQKLLEVMESRKRITRRVCLATGEASLHPGSREEEVSFDGENLYKVFGPGWRMLIIGAGELARRVAQLALTLDYAVTICDSRPEYASGWEVEGSEFVTASPASWIHRFAPDQHTVILALAHSPALEDEALFESLKYDAFYIGALGSVKNQEARLKRLLRMGLQSAQLSRIHGPVGLDIGSRTPAEIAIAINAALVQARNHRARELGIVEAWHG